MSDFYFKYFGNKRSENDELLHLLPEITETCTTIVEPFGGTCSFSRWMFGKNADVEYYVNDINAHCTSFCNNFHEKADEIIDSYNSLVREFLSMDNYEQRKVAFKKMYGELATLSASDTSTNAKYLFYTRHNLGGWRAFLHNRENIIKYIDKPKYYKRVEESTKFFKKTKYRPTFQTIGQHKKKVKFLFEKRKNKKK